MNYVKLELDMLLPRLGLRFSSGAILLLSSLILQSSALAGVSFSAHHIDAGFFVRQPVLVAKLDFSGQPYIVLQGDDAEYHQWIAIYRFQGRQFEKVYKFEIPSELLYFDTGQFDCSAGTECSEALYFISSDGLVTWDMAHGEFRAVMKISSIYHQERSGRLRYQDFVRDIDDDGLDDLLVPDSQGYRIRRQEVEGQAAADLLLPGSVRMKLSDEGVQYGRRSIYATDLNFDERTDLFFLRDQQMRGFLQQEDGSFSEEAIVIQIPLEFISEAGLEAMEENWGGVDQSDLVQTEDVDGDGRSDLIIRYDRSDSEEQLDENKAQTNKAHGIKVIFAKFDGQDQS